MGAALVLHAAPHAVALEEERHLVVATHVRGVGAEQLELPAHALGVALVHVEQVLGEEVGLLAPLGPPDLDDHVLFVVGVLGQEQDPQLLLEAGDGGFALVCQRAPDLAVVAARRPQHLLGLRQLVEGGPVLAVALHDGLELLVAPRLLPQGAPVGDHVGVRQAPQDVVVLLLQVGESLEHLEIQVTGRASRREPL